MRWVSRFGAQLVASGLTLGLSAHADVDDDCIAASSSSADLQAKGQLVEARAAIAKCAASACPTQIRTLCVDRAEKLASMIPSIVFDVKDASANDIPSVTVTIDGVQSAQSITSAFTANPGAHKFAFRSGSSAIVEKTFVLRESERGRRETIVLSTPTAPNATSAQTPTTTTTQNPTESDKHNAQPDVTPASRGSGQRIAGITILSVGIVGGVAAAIFGGLFVGRHNDFTTVCPTPTTPGCINGAPSSTVTSIINDENTFELAGAVTGVLGGVAIITGIIVFATAPKSSSSSALRLVPTVGFRQAGLSLTGVF